MLFLNVRDQVSHIQNYKQNYSSAHFNLYLSTQQTGKVRSIPRFKSGINFFVNSIEI
jgi:hypothetical protein